MLKFCPRPGCDQLLPAGVGLCDKHRAATWREIDERRGNSNERGYDAAWRRFRRRFLSEFPLCRDCQQNGVLTVATEVHHLVKIRDNPARRLDPSNVIGLCKPCHSKRTMKGE